VSSHPLMVNPRQLARPLVFALLLSLLSAATVSTAYGQQFTLAVTSPLAPSAVDPGEKSLATISIGATGGFDSPVSFDTTPCTVTPVQSAGTPVCSVSPGSVTPPGQAFVTITTTGGAQGSGATPPGLYTITITGTSGATSIPLTLTLNVVNVTEDYTLSVAPTLATPSPVTAGSIATTIVTVTPIASYTGNVTLNCLSITPVVEFEPYCSFNPPSVAVTAGSAPQPSTLTITTLGQIPNTGLRSRRIFYAIWLLLPGLALVGVGATGSRRKHLLGALLLVGIAGSLIFMPSCSSATRTNSPNGGYTPNNTYTFIISGTDQNGASPGNPTSCPVGQTCNLATVQLVVN
jgi:hypothetical protein